MRPLIFPRDQFDGVEDSDDETEEEETALVEDEEDEEDAPQVVGELEVDMQEEAEEFLKFSREALGISSEMWTDIIRDREHRDGMSRPNSPPIIILTWLKHLFLLTHYVRNPFETPKSHQRRPQINMPTWVCIHRQIQT